MQLTLHLLLALHLLLTLHLLLPLFLSMLYFYCCCLFSVSTLCTYYCKYCFDSCCHNNAVNLCNTKANIVCCNTKFPGYKGTPVYGWNLIALKLWIPFSILNKIICNKHTTKCWNCSCQEINKCSKIVIETDYSTYCSSKSKANYKNLSINLKCIAK